MGASDHPIRRPSEAPAPAESVAEDAPADDGVAPFPEPPTRGSLDDDDLVPLVGRHTSDTATVDLIGILQAQMQLRAAEAARFAAWEEQMLRIGTDEALGELERTRLHFTGVIPVQTSATIIAAGAVPTNHTLVPERLEKAPAPIVRLDAVPEQTGENVHSQRARLAEQKLLETAETRTIGDARSAGRHGGSARRILLVTFSLVAVLVVAAAFVLTGIALGSVASMAPVAAALGAVAVLGAAWLGVLVGRFVLRPGGIRSSVAGTGRSTWAIVGGLVLGTAIGEGLVRTTQASFTWQGYLMSLVQVHGIYPELSLVAGVVAALVVAFVVVLVVDRSRQAA